VPRTASFDPFDQWAHEHIEGESSAFEPGLWFVALDGDEVVGAVCCRASTPRSEDAANVNILGVRPPWRGRGIGRALLLAAFGELRRRGIPAVDLGVDSENQTGATRLYEGVGMQTVRREEWWEKSSDRGPEKSSDLFDGRGRSSASSRNAETPAPAAFTGAGVSKRLAGGTG
jgi:ribosomal protein S18 acetylase RimI-like enzyme